MLAPGTRRFFSSDRRLTLVAMLVGILVLVAGCGRAIDRPAHGAAPGSEGANPTSAVPPTLQAAEHLRSRVLPTPSPGLVLSPSPSPVAAVASPSPAPAPPIVRTIAPGPDASLPPGAPVNVSAVLFGRGADLATAALTVNGADTKAAIDRRSPRDWTIHASPALPPGAYTARVLVSDASGANGGFTWRFSVGVSTGQSEVTPAASQATPPPKPHNP
jgi:hypothetical protein